jgi:FKBP-type peptidyl-prolyl cis-trans isomerase
MGNKSALARKREAQEAKRRRKSRLRAAGIGAVAFVVLAALVGTILYFTVFKESPPKSLVIKDLVVGTGDEAQAGDTVSVNYTGWLWHGKEFESSSYQFTLGQGGVIKGWDQGIVGMKVGGTRKLTIPPDLAYGEEGAYDQQGNETIPPNATLTFEVELLAVE